MPLFMICDKGIENEVDVVESILVSVFYHSGPVSAVAVIKV